MASVSWEKFKSASQVKAVMRHDCQDTREATREHTNGDINKDLTHTNTGIWDKYAEAKQRYDSRMAELPVPARKDAVVGLGFSIPVPRGLPEDQEDEWCSRVLELMGARYGLENVCCFAVHRDEKHEYIDPDTKQKEISRTHAQGILIPESNGRLCAKEVTARWQMIAFNREIHEMTVKEYGLEWMTGKQSKSRGSVEEMKALSLKAENEALRAENEELLARNDELKSQVSGLLSPIRAAKRALKTEGEKRAEAAEERLAAAEKARHEAEAAQQEAEESTRKAVQEAQEALQARQEAEGRYSTLQSDTEGLEARKKALEGGVSALTALIENYKQARPTVTEKTVCDYLRKIGKYEAIEAIASKDLRNRYEQNLKQRADEIENQSRQNGHHDLSL